MADRTPNTNQLRAWSDTSMGYALRQDLEPNAYSTVHAIDALRLAVLAASADLVDALNERTALAAGTRVVVLDDEDDDEPCDGNCGHCGGYFCEAHNLRISCSHPDYDLLVDEHEARHAEEQDEAASDQVMAATEAGRLVQEWEARKKSCLDPTPTSVRVHEHEARHAEEQDEAASDQVLAATEIRQYLDTVETALQDPKFAAADATRRLIRVVRAGIAAGAAPATLIAMLTALLAEEADQ